MSGAQVREYLDGVIAGGGAPGLQYVAVDRAGVLFEYAGGMARVAERAAMDVGMTMMAYSMSKTITAVAVLQLVERGKIELDAPVANFVGGVPFGPAVTIRRLLSHTAGVRNPIPLRWVHAVGRHDAFCEPEALDAVVRKNATVAAPPGSAYGYSNLGYWLLGAAVEHAAGVSFEEYVAENVFRPLAVGAGELSYRIADGSRHAHGYLSRFSWMNLFKGFLIEQRLIGGVEGRWMRIEPHYVNGPAFGGCIGTARAFAEFLRDQLQAKSSLFEGRGRELLYEQQRLKDGAAVAMTLGWHVGESELGKFFFKEGGGAGFHSMMRLYADRGMGTVVIANSASAAVVEILDLLDAGLKPRAS